MLWHFFANSELIVHCGKWGIRNLLSPDVGSFVSIQLYTTKLTQKKFFNLDPDMEMKGKESITLFIMLRTDV